MPSPSEAIAALYEQPSGMFHRSTKRRCVFREGTLVTKTKSRHYPAQLRLRPSYLLYVKAGPDFPVSLTALDSRTERHRSRGNWPRHTCGYDRMASPHEQAITDAPADAFAHPADTFKFPLQPAFGAGASSDLSQSGRSPDCGCRCHRLHCQKYDK